MQACPKGTLGDVPVDLTIVTDNMAELLVNKNNVNMTFSSVADYSNGIIADVPDQLILSKTTPYNLSVRAEKPDFSSGSENFPVSMLGIGAINGQAGIQNITSLSTQNKMLIRGAEATVDKSIGLRYTIKPAASNQLVTKEKGVYTNNLIFTLSEH